MDKLNVLNHYRNEYYRIENELSEPHKSVRLGQLMTELEKCFNIPMLNNQTFNDENKAVMQLYKEISNSRDL